MKNAMIGLMVLSVIKIIISAATANIAGVLVGVGLWNLARWNLKVIKKNEEAKVRRANFKEVK